MRSLLFSALVIILLNCSPNSYEQGNDRRLIEGDWISDPVEEYSKKRSLIFSFEDSMCSIGPYGNFSKYVIDHDSLLVPAEEAAYKILKLTKDSLILFSPSDDQIPDTIYLKKLQPKNTIKPAKIYVNSSGCFGTCPMLFLEIDSSGKLAFLGRNFTDTTGGFRGQINEKDLISIFEKIRNIMLDSLEKTYEASWSDDQTVGIAIFSGSKKYITSVYGYNQEPVELRILIHKLMNVYKTASLVSDTTVNEAYARLKENEADGFNLPPPWLR